MRAYDVAIASLAIDAPIKWTDNLLSHHDLPGLSTARRGVARRIPRPTLLLLGLTRELHVTLGMSVRDALRLAGDLLADDADGAWCSGPLSIALDRGALERALDERLRVALESAPTPRRGRPPGRRK